MKIRPFDAIAVSISYAYLRKNLRRPLQQPLRNIVNAFRLTNIADSAASTTGDFASATGRPPKAAHDEEKTHQFREQSRDRQGAVCGRLEIVAARDEIKI